jgi:hypothetical protein
VDEQFWRLGDLIRDLWPEGHWTSDFAHMLKICRNRIAWPGGATSFMSHVRSHFWLADIARELGVPESTLDFGNKMDDRLPEHFVKRVYVREAFEKEHPEFLVVLVPFILGSRSRLDALSHKERLGMKALQVCMLFLQLLWQDTDEARLLDYKQIRRRGAHALYWSHDLCCKFISTAYNESLFIVDRDWAVEHGSSRGGSLHVLSTTRLEHFFGAIQRAANGDITAGNIARIIRAELSSRARRMPVSQYFTGCCVALSARGIVRVARGGPA